MAQICSFKLILEAEGPVTQGLEYTPDKRGVSSSNLLEPNDSKFIAVNLLCTKFFRRGGGIGRHVRFRL